MVYEKKRSGDPDYDDKVPRGDHLTVIKDGDGKVVGRLDPALGPVTAEGSHLSVGVTAEDLDTRPEPGGQAEVKAEVQTVEPEDTPREEVTREDVANAQTENPDAAGEVQRQENSANAAKQVQADQAQAEVDARTPTAQRARRK